MSKESLINDIQSVEKAIKASEELRQRALTSKTIYENQLKETEDEFKQLGTTAEKGRKEIQEIENKVEENLKAIESMIPYELLEQFKLL